MAASLIYLDKVVGLPGEDSDPVPSHLLDECNAGLIEGRECCPRAEEIRVLVSVGQLWGERCWRHLGSHKCCYGDFF